MISALFTYIGTIGGAAALVAAFVWLTRTLIMHSLSKDLELYKTRLKEDADRELERTRNDLKRVAFEYETRFGRLHEEVVKAILEVYPPLHELYQAVLSYLAIMEWGGEPTKPEKLKIVAEKARLLNQLYTKNRILFPKRLYQQMDKFSLELSQSTNNFTFGLQREKSGRAILPDQDPWGDAMRAVQEKIKPLFDSMHDELQGVLGFPTYVVEKQGLEPPAPTTPPQSATVPSETTSDS